MGAWNKRRESRMASLLRYERRREWSVDRQSGSALPPNLWPTAGARSHTWRSTVARPRVRQSRHHRARPLERKPPSPSCEPAPAKGLNRRADLSRFRSAPPALPHFEPALRRDRSGRTETAISFVAAWPIHRRNQLSVETGCASGSECAPAFAPAFHAEANRDRMASIEVLVGCCFALAAAVIAWDKCSRRWRA